MLRKLEDISDYGKYVGVALSRFPVEAGVYCKRDPYGFGTSLVCVKTPGVDNATVFKICRNDYDSDSYAKEYKCAEMRKGCKKIDITFDVQ